MVDLDQQQQPGEFEMSYYNEYQKIDLAANHSERLEQVFEAWQQAGKPVSQSSEFESICDGYDIPEWELSDIIDEVMEPVDPQDMVENN